MGVPDGLQNALADRYALERELGRGGMAVVYLASDLRHDRPVALKVLLPELAATLGPERFQREIKLAARLQHPHILTVHDSGEAAGQLWFTMPFVEGESLRDRLRRERQLGVDDALRIGREAAAALDYAHRHGVVHRDIKPENILLTADGDTLVADFGIARALGGAGSGSGDGDGGLTQTGLAIGTPAYMSPEQAAGDKTLDARSDVYSLASVLYELLAGEPPFAGPTAQATALRRLTDPPPSVRRLRPNVPEAVDDAIRRALAPVPADRHPSAAEFGRALATPNVVTAAIATPSTPPMTGASTGAGTTTGAAPSRRRLPIAALTLGLGFVLGLGVLFAWRRAHPGSEEAGPKRVAVLPFENLGDSSQAYFADGVSDEVRGKLSQLAGLAVIARASSNEYRHTTKAPQQIGRELGADYLLTATVRWEKHADGTSRVRVSPELVRVEPGAAPTTTWQQPFDAALTDVFQVQAEIAGKVASALDVTLGDSTRRRLVAKPTASLAAYDAYLQGVALTDKGDLGSTRKAGGFFEQAVGLDSNFVAAWSRLARTRSYLYGASVPTAALAAAAREAADRTRALAPESAEAFLALRGYYANVLNDQSRALAAAEAGLARAPNDVDLLTSTAAAERSLGRWEASLEHYSRAATLDPRSVTTAAQLGTTLLLLRRQAEARVGLERALRLAPDNLGIRSRLVAAALADGDLRGARRLLSEAPASVDSAAAATGIITFYNLPWALDTPYQDLLLRLPPSAFDDDRGSWAGTRAELYHLRGQQRLARTYADTTLLECTAQLRDAPDVADLHMCRGIALAYLGRKAEAIAEGRRGLELAPLGSNAPTHPGFKRGLARIYTLVGEPELALDELEGMFKLPYYVTPAWLRIDPTFAPLKGNPRFEKLLAGG
ncbi:MAG TPA: serine/threonine-protein kinase [Gemmatimonadales bacterium]|nr:serine/threonine-protein kinase [Gemmatimonadales bacterium]